MDFLMLNHTVSATNFFFFFWGGGGGGGVGGGGGGGLVKQVGQYKSLILGVVDLLLVHNQLRFSANTKVLKTVLEVLETSAVEC